MRDNGGARETRNQQGRQEMRNKSSNRATPVNTEKTAPTVGRKQIPSGDRSGQRGRRAKAGNRPRHQQTQEVICLVATALPVPGRTSIREAGAIKWKPQSLRSFKVFGALLQKAGPYLLLEILLPGGTLFALLLFLYKRRQQGGAEMPRAIFVVATRDRQSPRGDRLRRTIVWHRLAVAWSRQRARRPRSVGACPRHVT